jgi:hypothetical protein
MQDNNQNMELNELDNISSYNPPVLVRSYATGEYARNIFAFIRYVGDAYNYMIQHERKRFERSFDLATDVMNYMIQEEEWEGGAGISQSVLDNYWSMHMIRF